MAQWIMLRADNLASRRPLVVLPLAALAAILPLLLHGISCGQDMPFHLQSWLDAAQQLRHLHYPRWAFTPAWNAGEPRFVFYPPLSWLAGALLTMVFPISSVPVVYIFLALAASGFAMHHLAKQYVGPNAALLAAVFYLANPYMLFNAFERTAFAELLAAAWIPLLLLAVLRERPSVRGIAIPIALLWLTNAPAAVMGCYTFALLAVLRAGGQVLRRSAWHSTLRLAGTYMLGTLLGLALPAYYLVPAAYERRFVQVAMAIIPNMRYQDNFLFAHTADAAHNAVNDTASSLAMAVLGLTVIVVSALLLRRRSGTAFITMIMAVLTVVITVMLVPVSTPIWGHLPNLAYLQFPWRLLTVLSAVLAFGVALLIGGTNPGLKSETWGTQTRGRFAVPVAALVLPLAMSFLGYSLYAQECDRPSLPTSIAALFYTHHGAPPTDEYTPTDADNDLLRTDNPGYWLAHSPNDPAPDTTPTAAQLNPNVQTDDTPVPDSQTLSAQVPNHFVVHAPASCYLILNLRDYPNWQVTTGCMTCRFFRRFGHVQRDDGLIAVQIPAGASTIDITWGRTADQTVGLALSLCALLCTLLSTLYTLLAPSSRRISSWQ